MPEPPLPSVAAKDLDLRIEGRRLRCRSLLPEGSALGCGPTLVLLHEALGCIAQWGRFPEALVQATGLPALVCDRYGHGASEPLEGPRAVDYLEMEAHAVLPRILETFGIGAPVLLGHSDGGSIALLFAAEFPDVPRALVCEASHVFLEELTVRGLRRAGQAYAQGSLRERLAPLHGGGVDALFQGWNEVWLAPERADWDITAGLGAIRAPLLMIQGEQDEYGSLAQIQAVISRVGGPAETCLVPHCGHAPHHQARAQVLDRVADFLRKVLVETKPPLGTSKP